MPALRIDPGEAAWVSSAAADPWVVNVPIMVMAAARSARLATSPYSAVGFGERCCVGPLDDAVVSGF